MRDHILALDQGTTSSRALIFDRSGGLVAVAQEEFPQHYPKTGWVEHDPDEIWTTQRETALAALSKAGLRAENIAAIGITNQRETTLLWNRKTGRPVAPAIVWQDRRTAGLCAELNDGGAAEMVRKKTGLVIDSYFSATKIRWLLDENPALRKQAEAGELAFGTVDSWLIWKLTGGRLHATDATNASRTLLYHIGKLDWDDELLDLFRVPRSLLPEVRPSGGGFAEVSGLPLLNGIPIAGVAGDQHAALFGQTCFEPGMAKNTYGTGSFVLMNTGETPVAAPRGLVSTIAWQADGKTEYALEGSVFIAGALVQWLRDGLGIIDKAEQIEALAASVEDSGGVVIVPAFTGLGAPHWDPHARGSVFGISRGTTRAHVARAALEAIAWQAVDVLEAMEAGGGLQLEELRVDGGAARNNLLMQIQADFLGKPVARPRMTETTALGAAFLAGLGVGFWKDRQAVAEQWKQERAFRPQADASRFQEGRQAWRRAIERTKGWLE